MADDKKEPEEEEELLDYEEEEEAPADAGAKGGDAAVKKGYVGIHSTGFRDFLLKPGGAILPDVAVLHVAGFGRNATSLPFWDDVYGFEMPCVQKSLAEDAIKAAIVLSLIHI